MLSSHLPAKFALAVQIQVANLSGRLLYVRVELVKNVRCILKAVTSQPLCRRLNKQKNNRSESNI